MQEFMDFDASKPELALKAIRKLIHERNQGAYLRFKCTAQTFSEQND
jgi:hypothetical protein